MEFELVPLLEKRNADICNALPSGTIEASQLSIAFRNAFNKKPDLALCSEASVVNCILNCAALGIVPETPEKHAYLIPRKNECELEISYRGFTHLILRGGKVSLVDSGVVRKGDEYEFQKGDPVICKVRPNLTTENRGAQPIIAAYCLIIFKDGGKKLELMDGDDLAKIEAAMMRQNNNKRSPAWREWPDEMMRKAPIKRIAKTCDLGPLVARASELDNLQFARLPSMEPKRITLPGGETVQALPRHEGARLTDIEPADQDGGITSESPDLF